MYVMGGFSMGEYFHDVHTLDVERLVWAQLGVGGLAPRGRISHSLTRCASHCPFPPYVSPESSQGITAPPVCFRYDSSLHLFGGAADGVCFADYYVLRPISKWERAERQREDASRRAAAQVVQAEWRTPAVSGTPPAARYGHTATLMSAGDGGDGGSGGSGSGGSGGSGSGGSGSGGVLFVVGGLGRKGRVFGDVHILDLERADWSSPRIGEERPLARGRHAATSSGSLLFIFGGSGGTSSGRESTSSKRRIRAEREEAMALGCLWVLDADGKVFVFAHPPISPICRTPLSPYLTVYSHLLFKGVAALSNAAGTQEVEDARRAAAADAARIALLQRRASHEGVVPYLLPQEESAAPQQRADDDYGEVEARQSEADEVACWLGHLGLSEHAYTFKSHEIDFEVLVELQEHDLRDMGVSEPTQRLRLLRAIDVLRTRGSLAPLGRKQLPEERLYEGRYRCGCEVNFGGSPAVLAIDTKTDRKVALKFFGSREEWVRMRELHKSLRCEQLVRMVDHYAGKGADDADNANGTDAERQPAGGKLGWGMPCLVLEYGVLSMADLMGKGFMTSLELKSAFEAMVRATQNMHAMGLIHGALQPECFRLYDGLRWRLVSLESCVQRGTPLAARRNCALSFAAPELVRSIRRREQAKATPALDVWSLGVILWQLCAQRTLFANEAEAIALLSVTPHKIGSTSEAGAPRSLRIPMGCIADEQARHLLGKLLQTEAAQRPELSQLLSHGFLNGGLDTIQLEATFGPIQREQVAALSVLKELGSARGSGSSRGG